MVRALMQRRSKSFAGPRLLLVGGNGGGVCDDAVGIAAAPGFLLVGRCFDDDGGDGGECVHYDVGRRSGGQTG